MCDTQQKETKKHTHTKHGVCFCVRVFVFFPFFHEKVEPRSWVDWLEVTGRTLVEEAVMF